MLLEKKSDDTEIFSADSDKEDSEEENSCEDKSYEESSDKETCMQNNIRVFQIWGQKVAFPKILEILLENLGKFFPETF